MAPSGGEDSGLFRIRRYGSGCLRQVARPADPGSAATRILLDRMWRTLADDGGVGLAAPQVAASLRVVVIRDPQQKGDSQRLDLVNPRITETFGPNTPFEEGCLSFPGLYTTVMRPRGVALEYENADGEKCTLRDDGLVARIAQHEIDHLDGVLFIDHLTFWKKWLLLPRLLWIFGGKVLGEMRFGK